ncbi:tdrd9 [Symbiodinium necroappetens]|uniref:Tdrd9 protein n=1 Tax=Symbiodinium necroappetens TaxID=1628268 RepID=A0A812R639_9DINO|nr:tdrd9 [Symbiodinium necroappetens]
MLRIAWNEVQPPEYLGLDGSGALKKELRRPKSSRGPWANFRSTTTSNTVGGGGRVGSPTRMSRRQAPLKEEPKATSRQKAPAASLIPRDVGRVAALQARTKELCAQRAEAAERERLLRTDLLKAEEEIANLTKELEDVRKVLQAEFARRTEAEQQLELKSMRLEDLPSIVAEEWFRVSELMRRTRLQSTDDKVDVGFDIQSLPLSVPGSVVQSVHGSEPDDMPGSKRSEGIASPWLLNRAVRHCPLGLSEISLSEAESFSVTESVPFTAQALEELRAKCQAPFAGNAYRAIKDAERAFGTGGREAEGWEEENVKVKGEFDSDSDDESGDSDFSTEETAAVAKAMAAPKRRRKEVSPNIIRGLDTLVYELILRVAQPGEGILVFLPGIGEISELQEALMPLEDIDQQAHMNWSPGLERNDLHFKVFVLHSLIPKDEQEGAVFDPPPPDTAHIILASNIAESSLTIPKVRVVIDFGLRRQLIYDKRRHMSCLVTTWVSQASAKQRCGRTGRVFEGVNIRLYTKQFFESYMDEFDPPEMQTAPLEKLYVNVKHLSAKLPAYQVTPTEFRKRTPKELLMLVAQPPEESAIASSIENLDQLGALTSDSESAELTVLGYLMMAVPLDVQLCRLVIFGALLGMPCEGVVCAAATSVQDPFTLPSHLIMKDPKEYAEAVRRSYESRKYFDHGHWSEPLMLRNLFVHFLLEFRKMQIDKCNRRGRVGRESTRSAFTRCAQLMASKFAVVPKRLVNLANAT